MADEHSALADASPLYYLHTDNTGPPIIFPPIRQETSSTSSSGTYRCLPEGRWILGFHGNCPRCHHRHDSVQVKVKVTKNTNHTSWVHCEDCNAKWAAFGARNDTTISLLSTTTTTPDPIEEGVRYSLIEVVKMAMNASALGTLTEQPSRGSSRQSSVMEPTGHSVHPLPEPSIAAARTELVHPVESCRCQQSDKIGTFSRKDRAISTIRGHILVRKLSKLKSKFASRFSRPREEKEKGSVVSEWPKMSPRQFEKSPVTTPPAADQYTELLVDRPPISPSRSEPVRTQLAMGETASVVESRPTGLLPEVAAFITSLDKAILNSKTDQERIEWMRSVYTDFKAQHRRKRGQAATVQAGVQCDLPRALPGRLNRRSAEVLGAGVHILGLEGVELRRTSIDNSDLTFDDQSRPDDSTPASFLRHSRLLFLRRVTRSSGTLRPQSMPGPNRPRSPTEQNQRHSLQALIHGRQQSTSTFHGQASSRASQASTLLGSNGLAEAESPETSSRTEDEGSLVGDNAAAPLPPPPPPPSSTAQNDAD
jgi:hypothetical protein